MFQIVGKGAESEYVELLRRLHARLKELLWGDPAPRASRRRRVRGDASGEAKIDELRSRLLVHVLDHDVARLQVAMHHSRLLRVEKLQRAGEVQRDDDSTTWGE